MNQGPRRECQRYAESSLGLQVRTFSNIPRRLTIRFQHGHYLCFVDTQHLCYLPSLLWQKSFHFPNKLSWFTSEYMKLFPGSTFNYAIMLGPWYSAVPIITLVSQKGSKSIVSSCDTTSLEYYLSILESE